MTIGEHHGGAGLPDLKFSGRLQFQQMLRDALACAAREGWREIILCDADFVDWPLGEREVIDSLQAWSRRGRHITLLAHHWDDAIRLHARFVSWRRIWSDIIDARACRTIDPRDFPSAIWSPAWAMRRHDLERCVGTATSAPVRRNALQEELQEVLRKSTPSFPASTLGL